MIKTKINNILISLIKYFNPYKNRVLSQKLFELAERYNTRPGTLNYNKKTQYNE